MLLLSNIHITPCLPASGKENLFPTQLTEENILNSKNILTQYDTMVAFQ